MAVWYAVNHTLVWRAAVRVYTCRYPTYADVNRRVDMSRKEVNVWMNRLQLLPHRPIYTNIQTMV